MARAAAVALVALALAGCSMGGQSIQEPIREVEVVEVPVPIAEAPTIPEKLLSPIPAPEDLVFYGPGEVEPGLCISTEGAKALQDWIGEHQARLEALRRASAGHSD